MHLLSAGSLHKHIKVALISQGDTFSPVSFIAVLDCIFRLYDGANAGMTVGEGNHTVRMSKFGYADDAALIDENGGQATARVTSLAVGSLDDEEQGDAYPRDYSNKC